MRYIIGGLWLTAQTAANLAALPSSSGRDASFEEVTIEGRIYDRVGVPKSTLEAAKLGAAEVFRRASVRLQWVDCTTAHDRIPTNSSCDAASSPLALSLNILGKGQSSVNPVECGYAVGVPAGAFADWAVIYYDRVEELTDHNVALRPVLLANVIAHEFGHLVLGSSSHSSHGIMTAKLPANVPMTLKFDPAQINRIRKAVMARVNNCPYCTQTETLIQNLALLVNQEVLAKANTAAHSLHTGKQSTQIGDQLGASEELNAAEVNSRLATPVHQAARKRIQSLITVQRE